MKQASNKLALGMATAVLVLLAACGQDNPVVEGSPTPTGPSVKIASPANEGQIKGNVVELDLEAQGFEIKPADGDTSGKSGHYHVFIDRPALAVGEVIPREAGIVHSADDPIKIPGLTVGRHKFTVVLGDGAHKRITDALAEVEVDVQGPSVKVTDAPAEAPAAGDFTFHVQVDGVELVGAANDQGAPGTTGHLHLYVDTDSPPVADGQPIPMDGKHLHSADDEFTFRGLAAGEHTIWVVLGDKTHVPFDPLVADRFTISLK